MIDLTYRQLAGIVFGSIVGLMQGLIVYGMGQIVMGAKMMPQPLPSFDVLLMTSGLLIIVLATITSISGFFGGTVAGIFGNGMLSGGQIGGLSGMMVGLVIVSMASDAVIEFYAGIIVGLVAGSIAGAVAGGIKTLVRDESYL